MIDGQRIHKKKKNNWEPRKEISITASWIIFHRESFIYFYEIPDYGNIEVSLKTKEEKKKKNI